MRENPAYGARRIAISLNVNKKRVSRVMRGFDLKPARRRKKPRKLNDENQAPVQFKNLIKKICPIKPNIIWAGDFTYIWFKNKFVYVATILDIFSRKIVGCVIKDSHNTDLVEGAFRKALSTTGQVPEFLHHDQGSEYRSEKYTKISEELDIKVSMSRKGAPWENGYQESFYAGFKRDLGNPSRFDSYGELIEAVHQTINYYNNRRIHSALKTSPQQFIQNYERRYQGHPYGLPLVSNS